MLWLVTMMIQTNAKRLYMSSTGLDVTMSEWCDLVMDGLSLRDLPYEVGHRLFKEPKTPRNCKICYQMTKKQHPTVWRCRMCHVVCRNCDLSGSHLKFVSPC